MLNAVAGMLRLLKIISSLRKVLSSIFSGGATDATQPHFIAYMMYESRVSKRRSTTVFGEERRKLAHHLLSCRPVLVGSSKALSSCLQNRVDSSRDWKRQRPIAG